MTTAPTYDIAEILDRLPQFTQLFERDGHIPKRKGTAWFVPCPFHDEKSPSCQVNNDRQKFNCFGCGAKGDPFDYWQQTRGVTFQQAIIELAAIAGVGPSVHLTHAATRAPRAADIPKPIVPLTGSALDKWHHATATLLASPTEIERIAAWRGIEPAAVAFAAERGLIGIYPYWNTQREAFLVEMPSPDGPLPVSVHIRLAPGTRGNEDSHKASWRYDPSGCGAWPWVVGDLATAKHIFIIEGQWDALALISVMGWHLSFPPTTAVAGLRGATSVAKLLSHSINPDAYIFAIADADGAGAKWFDEKGLLTSLTERLDHHERLHAFWPAAAGCDLNDLVKSGELTRDVILHSVIPHLPAKHPPHTPTFIEWCRKHAQDEDAIGQAASHTLSDLVRSRWPRRPLRAWMAHWQRTEVPAPMLANLQAAWEKYHAHPFA